MINNLSGVSGEILLKSDEYVSWLDFISMLTSSQQLKFLMSKGLNVYFEWCNKIYYLNDKSLKDLEDEFTAWSDNITIQKYINTLYK